MSLLSHSRPHLQPKFGNPKIWRFIDLVKLINLLIKRELYFPRLDQLNDPCEGYITRSHLKRIQEDYGKESATQVLKELKYDRIFYYASCWHMNEYESDAMWNMYCGNREGVALQTTYKELARAFNSVNMRIGQVRYIDYENDSGIGFMDKRYAYEHEREVRLVYGNYKARRVWERAPKDNYDQLSSSLPVGASFKFNLEKVVHGLWIHPRASSMFYDAVAEIVNKFTPKLTARIKWSELKEIPSWLESR